MNASTKKTLSLLVALTSAAACGAFVGCSSTDNTIVNGTDGGVTPTGDGAVTPTGDGAVTPTGDGSTGDDSSTGDDGSTPDAGPTVTRTGSVTLTQTSAAGSYFKSAYATFTETTPGASPYDCTTTAATSATTGATCNFIDCTYTAPVVSDAGTVDAGDAAAAELPNAGDITLTGGSGFPSTGIILAPDTTTGVYSVTTPASLSTDTTKYFSSGDMVVYTAAGDLTSIGAFTSTLVGPADIQVSAPAATLGVVPAFSRSSDLNVAWTGGAQNTNVTVSLVASNSSTHESKSVVCTFPAFAAGGAVPTAGGLANLPTVDGTTWTGSLLIAPNTSSVATATDNSGNASGDNWSVTTTLNATETVDRFTTSN